MVTAERIFHFTQDDLLEGNVCMLDTVSALLVWVPKKARENDKKVAFETALEYWEKSPQPRGERHVVEVTEGNEPTVRRRGSEQEFDRMRKN